MSARTRPGPPAVEDVLTLDPAVRLVAPQEWEDGNGHVNVSAFYDFHMAAATVAVGGLGWSEDYRERTGHSIFSVEHHVRFYDEALVGHDVSAHFRLVDRTERMLHAVSILVNRSTGRVANTLEVVEAHVDLRTRRTAPFPEELGQALDRTLAQHRELPWTVPLNSGMGLR